MSIVFNSDLFLIVIYFNIIVKENEIVCGGLKCEVLIIYYCYVVFGVWLVKYDYCKFSFNIVSIFV